MDSLFVWKKIIAFFLEPLGFVLLCLLLGLLLAFAGSRKGGEEEKESKAKRRARCRKLSLGFFLVAFLVLYAFSTPAVSETLVYSLERTLPNRPDTEEFFAQLDPPSHIVVLASGSRGENLPDLSRLSHAGLARVAGGADLWKRYPEATLVLTGQPKETQAMRAVAERLGVAPDRIWEENESRDTKDHAAYLAPVLRGKTFLLVTSAVHMPRSAGLFRGQGLDPVVMPVDLRVEPDVRPSLHPKRWAARPSWLQDSNMVVHELLGLAWARLRGQWSSEPRAVPPGSQESPESGSPSSSPGSEESSSSS